MKCPCCDQELPIRNDLVFSDSYNAVFKDGKCAELTGLQYKIISVLRRRNLTIIEIIDSIYSDREDGGPETAKSVIACSIRAMNARLKPLGIKVGAERKGAHGPLTKIMPI